MLNSKTYKFLLLVLVLATVLLLFGKLSGEMWLELIPWLAGSAAVRGSAEHIQTRVRKKRDELGKVISAYDDTELAGAVVDRTKE